MSAPTPAVPDLPELHAGTDVGRARRNNEDAVAIDAQVGLAVLADGMGGYNAGEVASQMLTSFLRDELGRWLSQVGQRASNDDVRRAMAICVENANRAIYNAAQGDARYDGMGTTLVMAIFRGDSVLIGHIGDSRAYRLRGAELTQLTRDHSLLQEQVDAGLMTPEEAARSSNKNLVTRAVGVDEHAELELSEHAVHPGDLFLLCSDGLSDMVPLPQLRGLLQAGGPLPALCDTLIQSANAHGGRDNIAVVLARQERRSRNATRRHWWPFKNTSQAPGRGAS